MVTLHEIAQRASVSIGTVDRVLHERGRVSHETKSRVRRIVEELNYRPNVMARNLSLKKIFRFGVLVPESFQDGKYWELPVEGVKKAVDELKMYNVDTEYFLYDKYSEISFQEACENVLKFKNHLDGLVVAPVLSKASEKMICQIPDTLPYIFIDSYIPQSHSLSYIGQESFQSGILAAKLMQLKIVCGRIVVYRVLPQDYHIEDRIRGFCSAYNNLSQFKIDIFDADRQQSSNVFYELSERIFSDCSVINGVFVPSACTHQVAEYLVSAGKAETTVLIGYDLVEQNRRYLADGVIDFLISQRPAMQGYQAIYSLYRHVILKEPVEQKMIMPIDILTKENLDYYEG
jgi:LacI family transcriptional regulator